MLAALDRGVEQLAYFGHREAKIAGRKVRVSRTGYSGDLGYEVWCRAADALAVWDAVWKVAEPLGVLPFGMQALYMTRIEAGLLLLDVDFASSRFAWTDADRATPHELGLGWMLRGIDADERRFVGRDAILREVAGKTSRFRTTGFVVDWRDWNRLHDEGGLIPPMDHTPGPGGDVPVRRRGRADRVRDELPVLAGPPAARRHRPGPGRAAAPGCRVNLEIPINHRYVHVAAHTARLPHYNPQRKTA